MQTTGYALRDAIKTWTLKRDSALALFPNTLFAFEGESKTGPQEHMQALLGAEECLAKLQTAQMAYNLAVRVEVAHFGPMLLAQAIKLAGGISRAEKLWKDIAQPKKDPYGQPHVRSEGQVVAHATLTSAEALQKATDFAKKAGALRSSIATANATVVDLTDLDAQLFAN